MSTRDVEKYRNKGLKTHVHTVMGVIEYGRK